MLERELKRLQLRKAALIDQSGAYRNDLQVEVAPLGNVSSKIDRGLAIARQARDLMLAFAPLLTLLLKRKSPLVETTAILVSNWRLARGVWEDWR